MDSLDHTRQGRDERAHVCPECGGTMRIQNNPSYGTGLAVHPFLLVCEKCGWTDFVATATPPERMLAPRRGGFLAWLRRRRARR